jgi:DNA-binding CsgD family transcriptional regulator
MGCTGHLRANDLIEIYRLIGECRDLWYDSHAWRSHLLNGLCRLVRGQVGVAGEIEWPFTGNPKIVQMFSLGWKDGSSHEHWQDFVDSATAQEDPVSCEVLKLLTEQRKLITRPRQELLGDRVWRASIHYNEYRKVDGVDECLYSYHPLPAVELDVVQVIEIHRELGDRRFGQRDAKVVDWLHREIGPMVGRQLVSARETSFSNLPPRLQQVLRLLLEGDSEKQVAARLGLSRATVHEYIQSLYRRCGVNNRNELMARWIRLNQKLADRNGDSQVVK